MFWWRKLDTLRLSGLNAKETEVKCNSPKPHFTTPFLLPRRSGGCATPPVQRTRLGATSHLACLSVGKRCAAGGATEVPLTTAKREGFKNGTVARLSQNFPKWGFQLVPDQ